MVSSTTLKAIEDIVLGPLFVTCKSKGHAAKCGPGLCGFSRRSSNNIPKPIDIFSAFSLNKTLPYSVTLSLP